MNFTFSVIERFITFLLLTAFTAAMLLGIGVSMSHAYGDDSRDLLYLYSYGEKYPYGS